MKMKILFILGMTLGYLEAVEKSVAGEAIHMTGSVSCKLKNVPIFKIVHHIPARDCSPEAQKDACGTWGTPTECKIQEQE